MKPWYETAFGSEYLDLYPHRNDEEARADVEAIIGLINPSRVEPLLDLGCGAGRHLLALCRAGFLDLTGLDLSKELLGVACERLRDAGCGGIDLVCCDMRRIPCGGGFGTVLSLFTTFGYFETDAEDAAVLAAVYEALRPGGQFLLDTLSREWTIASLVPEEEAEHRGRQVHVRRAITDDGLRVEKVIRTLGDASNEDRVHLESVRMYSPDELANMASEAGFVELRICGSLSGEPHGPGSRRLVLVARKGGSA